MVIEIITTLLYILYWSLTTLSCSTSSLRSFFILIIKCCRNPSFVYIIHLYCYKITWTLDWKGGIHASIWSTKRYANSTKRAISKVKRAIFILRSEHRLPHLFKTPNGIQEWRWCRCFNCYSCNHFLINFIFLFIIIVPTNDDEYGGL